MLNTIGFGVKLCGYQLWKQWGGKEVRYKFYLRVLKHSMQSVDIKPHC